MKPRTALADRTFHFYPSTPEADHRRPGTVRFPYRNPDLTSPDTPFRLPVFRLLGGLVALNTLGTVAGWMFSPASGEAATSANAPVVAPVIAWSASLVGAVAGVVLLNLIATRPDRFALGFMAASASRMAVGVVLCYAAANALALRGPTVWYCFLAAALVCLIFETAWALRVNSRLAASFLAPATLSAPSGVVP